MKSLRWPTTNIWPESYDSKKRVGQMKKMMSEFFSLLLLLCPFPVIFFLYVAQLNDKCCTILLSWMLHRLIMFQDLFLYVAHVKQFFSGHHLFKLLATTSHMMSSMSHSSKGAKLTTMWCLYGPTSLTSMKLKFVRKMIVLSKNMCFPPSSR